MNRIRQLDPKVVDQIAAGEVVERPASVVKELVENALDAGASRIEIVLQEGGTRRIEVRDDGSGIPSNELRLAVGSHATSKLRSAEDLDAVATLGFRGEALASIAAVSRFEIVSRPREAGRATSLRVRFGVAEEPRETAGPHGTRVIVEDLFAELPARRKFLKRAQTELAHSTAWAERLALAHEGVAFRVEHEGRVLLDVAAEDDLAARCAAVFGAGLSGNMVAVEEARDTIRLLARVGPPESARRDARRVHVFLNGRWVRDPRLLRAVREGVREFVPVGHYPTLYLALLVAPQRVDVNVHPQKTEVRFRDERLVFGTVVRALQRGLARAPWATRSVGGVGSHAAPGARWERPLARAAGSSAALAAEDFASERAGETRSAAERQPAGAPELPVRASGEVAADSFVSIARTFLVREVPGGMEILDQHALHERVNLEELRAEVRRGQVLAQPLLVPALVELSRVEADLLLSRSDVFRALGVELEAFGETSLAIRSVPARLTRLHPEKLIQDLLGIAQQHHDASPEQILEESLHSMSCRGAVMAGDYLDAEALQDLLRRGARLPQDRTCAHGRPVRVFLSTEDLEKAFHRR